VGRKHKTHPEEDKDKKIKGQREAIKKLEREVKRLKSELATLNVAFKKSAAYMSTESKVLSVEELIKAAEKNQTLEIAKTEADVDDREVVRRKWAQWNKERNGSKNEDEDY
jgi:hypothetical protein